MREELELRNCRGGLATGVLLTVYAAIFGKEPLMNPRILILAAAALVLAVGYSNTAWALSEDEIIRLHELCIHGDRDACARRDAAIHDHDHEADWRQRHPEWYR
jgi:hypothetical protein